MFSGHPFKKAEIHSFFYRNFLTAPIWTVMGDEVSMNILLCYSAPPVPKTTAATKVRFPIWCVSSPLTVIPQVSEMFYRVSYHFTSAKNISSVLEMACWQRLTANPDSMYRAFYQTGFFSADECNAGGFTRGQNVTNLCLILQGNKHLK